MRAHTWAAWLAVRASMHVIEGHSIVAGHAADSAMLLPRQAQGFLLLGSIFFCCRLPRCKKVTFLSARGIFEANRPETH